MIAILAQDLLVAADWSRRPRIIPAMRASSGSFALHWVLSFWLLLATRASASTGFHGPAVVQSSSSASLRNDIGDSEEVDTSNSSSSDGVLNNATAAVSPDVAPSNATTLPEWRRQLPVELQNKTKTLQRIVVPGSNGCRVEVYLLGTAHVSNDSSRDVRTLLEAIDPNILFLELCDQRIPMMLTPPENLQVEELPDAEGTEKGFWKRLRRGKPKNIQPAPQGGRSMYGMAAGLLTSMQQDYAQSLGVELGGEFRVAYNYWDEQRQKREIHMILGDRPLYVTLLRAWQELRLWGKLKLMVGLVMSSLQKPKPEELREWIQKILSDDTGDLLTESIAELANHFPALERVIIQERDTYMACKLYQTCRALLQPPSNPYYVQEPRVHKLVAIVGAGHVNGMCQLLTKGNGKQQPEEMLAPLLALKKPIPEEERQFLIFDVMEVNPELLQSMVQAMSKGSAA